MKHLSCAALVSIIFCCLFIQTDTCAQSTVSYLRSLALAESGRIIFDEMPARGIRGNEPLSLADKMMTGRIDADADLPEGLAKRILTRLKDIPVPSAVIGGVIRDALRGIPEPRGIKEVDSLLVIDISGLPEEGSPEFDEGVETLVKTAVRDFILELYDRHMIDGVGELDQEELDDLCVRFASGVANLRVDGMYIDFLGCITNKGRIFWRRALNFEEADAFSMNRIAVTTQGDVFDAHGGIRDAENGILRLMGGPGKIINHQTVFRGLRFLLQPGMKMEPETRKRIFGLFNSGTVHADRYRLQIREVREVTELFRHIETLVAGLRRHAPTRWLVKPAIEYGRRRILRWLKRNRAPSTAFASYEAIYIDEYERYFGIHEKDRVNYSLLAEDHPARVKSFHNIVDRIINDHIFPSRMPVNFYSRKMASRRDPTGIGTALADIYMTPEDPRDATKMLRAAGAEEFLRCVGINLERMELRRVIQDVVDSAADTTGKFLWKKYDTLLPEALTLARSCSLRRLEGILGQTGSGRKRMTYELAIEIRKRFYPETPATAFAAAQDISQASVHCSYQSI